MQISPQADLSNWQHVSSTPIIGQICLKAFQCKQLVAFCYYNGLCMMLICYIGNTCAVGHYIHIQIYSIHLKE